VLGEDDVNRIIPEEQLRWSIRRDLEAGGKKNSTSFTSWDFLNSAFGLLIMSSVVIAGLGRLYAEHQQHVQEEIRKRTEIMKVTSEIDNRVTRIISLKKDLNEASLAPKDRQSKSIYIWRIIVGDQFYNPLSQSFATRTSAAYCLG